MVLHVKISNKANEIIPRPYVSTGLSQGTSYIVFKNRYDHFIFDITSTIQKDYDGENILDLTDNDTNKIFITSAPGPYHFWFEVFPTIVECGKKFDGYQIIIDSPDEDSDNSRNLKAIYRLANNILSELGIRTRWVDSGSYDAIKINNFIIPSMLSMVPIFFDPSEYSELVRNAMGAPARNDRLIYLSRSKIHNIYNDQKRIDDDAMIDNYFASLGFDVICPEDYSDEYELPRKISEAKVLVSLTGSGLGNMIFMRPGTTVIDLKSYIPRIANLPDSGNSIGEIPMQYEVLAYFLSINYFSISNTNLNAEMLINKLDDNLEIIKAMMNKNAKQ